MLSLLTGLQWDMKKDYTANKMYFKQFKELIIKDIITQCYFPITGVMVAHSDYNT